MNEIEQLDINQFDIDHLTNKAFELDYNMFSSPEYIRGVMEGMEFALASITITQKSELSCPFLADTAEADAWIMGSQSGIAVASDAIIASNLEIPRRLLPSCH